MDCNNWKFSTSQICVRMHVSHVEGLGRLGKALRSLSKGLVRLCKALGRLSKDLGSFGKGLGRIGRGLARPVWIFGKTR